eukprot:372783-Prymnesium_polylepis.1
MVQCNCPQTYALLKRHMIGEHLDRELGSERAAVNTIFKARLAEAASARRRSAPPAVTVGGSRLRASEERNLRKTAMAHHLHLAGAAPRGLAF